MSKLQPQTILGKIFAAALVKAKTGFSKMDTEALQSAGLIIEVVEAVRNSDRNLGKFDGYFAIFWHI